MPPDAITCLFKEAYDTFPPLEGKPTDDDLLAIWETLLPLLMVIPNDQLNGIHSITAILTEAAKYETEHGNAKFVRPARLPLYDKNIADNATTVVCVCAEAAHKSRLDDNDGNGWHDNCKTYCSCTPGKWICMYCQFWRSILNLVNIILKRLAED
jgi:hypothetical protein